MSQSSLSTSTFASETAKQNHNIKIAHNISKQHQSTKLNKIAQFSRLKLSALATFFPLATNAALRCDKRLPHLSEAKPASVWNHS